MASDGANLAPRRGSLQIAQGKRSGALGYLQKGTPRPVREKAMIHKRIENNAIHAIPLIFDFTLIINKKLAD